MKLSDFTDNEVYHIKVKNSPLGRYAIVYREYGEYHLQLFNAFSQRKEWYIIFTIKRFKFINRIVFISSPRQIFSKLIFLLI